MMRSIPEARSAGQPDAKETGRTQGKTVEEESAACDHGSA